MGYIGQRPPQNAFSSPGLWTPNSALVQQYRGLWDAGADPYWAYTKLLIQPSATDSSIVDKSSGAKTVTSSNGFSLSGVSAFPGGGSVSSAPATPGLGSNRIEFANSSDWYFGTDNFAIELLYTTTTTAPTTGGMGLLERENSYGLRVELYTNGNISVRASSNNSSYDVWNTTTICAYYANTINHTALVRTGSSFTLYHNGVSRATTTSSAALYAGTSPLAIGGYPSGGGNSFAGNIYAARVTVGSDRGYTGSTIPLPTGPWPTPLVSNTPITPAMASASQGGFTITASGYYHDGTGDTFPYEAFDQSFAYGAYQGWSVAHANNPAWIKVQCPTATVVNRIGLLRYYSVTNSAPKDYVLQGSNDDSNWTALLTVSNKTDWVAGETVWTNIANTTAYTYYRIYCTAFNDATYCGFSEIVLVNQ